jgi:hypothetical protein
MTAVGNKPVLTPAAASKPIPIVKARISQNVTPPETSFTAEAVVLLPPDPSPVHSTLDWELQYPPGGSTHPSYAYPQLDPRLLFNPGLVPIIDGLPNVFQLPPLVLPMGWRHVSWSGFLPIVFDTYQQAFKLTPIGPLPLTCEEVQQGGLAKFIPGGECHPEAGMLPDITALSDGSEVICNFEDVDWILPWPKGDNFDGTSADGALRLTLGTQSSSTETDVLSTPLIMASTHYIEARDCPDNVVDIDEAWRWLKEKDTNPSAAFEPSRSKTWRGTGIHRTSRRYKQPISSLIGLAIADVQASPNNDLATYLINQNSREFCPFRSVATPVHVNITLIKETEITLVELLSYFPNSYLWRKGADRFVQSGLTAADITNFINWTRGLAGDAVKQRDSINDHIMWEYEAPGSRKRVRIVRKPESATYTTERWSYGTNALTDYPLLGLTHGLRHVPDGVDAGPLTAMIKWCREQGRYETLLSDVPELLEAVGIQPLIEPDESGDPDKEVLGRFVEILKQDRKRVLKDAGERKRAIEREEDGKRKRVKAE